MYVYLMKVANYYKIGISKTPEKRRSAIQVHNPLDVILCATYKSENAKEIESNLHNEFSVSRTIGEWFELKENDLYRLKIDYGFEFKIDLEKIYKEDFDKTEKYIDTRKYRVNSYNLETAINLFEDTHDCQINNFKNIKRACFNYDIEVVLEAINYTLRAGYNSHKAYSKLDFICKLTKQKKEDPEEFLLNTFVYIAKSHFKTIIDDNQKNDIRLRFETVRDVDGATKLMHQMKFTHSLDSIYSIMMNHTKEHTEW